MKIPYPRYAAEFVGTFLLASSVAMSIMYALPFTPLVAALVLGTSVFVLGPICGAHFNPAISIGLWSAGKISARDTIGYIIAQLLAGVLVYLLLPLFTGSPLMPGVDGTLWTAIAEAIGTVILAMGVASVHFGKVKDGSGFAVGGSLLVGVFFATSASDGMLNPAVALGAGSLSLAYAAGPLVGAVIGVWLYKWMAQAK
jgi:glycerol uptake facilitator-like aquaporin